MDDLSYLGLMHQANFLFTITLHIFIACAVGRIMSVKDVAVQSLGSVNVFCYMAVRVADGIKLPLS